jgi:hypothetical protein
MSPPGRYQSMERRSENRYPYEGPVFFATYSSFHAGELLNYSNSGLFIKSEALLPVGELITVAVPYLVTSNHKRKAVVIWSEKDAIGVQFINVH